MPRTQRLVVIGMPHHITQRGNRRQKTFFCREDYETYLRLLGRLSKKFGLDICAYCLMPNHTHLIGVPCQQESMSRTLGQVHASHSRRVNRKHQWQGHLWQERFHSVVMDETHVIAATRYVLYNPVEAGLAAAPEKWPYSSARAHLGLEASEILKTDLLDELIGDWGEFLRIPPKHDEKEQLRKHTFNGLPLGSEAFLDDLEARFGRSLRSKRRGRPPLEE